MPTPQERAAATRKATADAKAKKFQATERQEANVIKKAEAAKPARYFITSPLAKAKQEDPNKYGNVAIKQDFQIHPGHTPNGYRDSQVLTFIDGNASTDDKKVADYLKEQWPELSVFTSRQQVPEALKYQREVEEAQAAFDAGELVEVGATVKLTAGLED